MENSKNEEIKETDSFVSSTTTEEYSVKTTSDRVVVIIKWLKKIFNLKALGTISGVVAAIAAVLAILPQNKVEKVKNEINYNTMIIEESFIPDEIIIDSLSTPDLQFVKDFQTSTLESILFWKSMHSIQPITEFGFYDSEKILGIVISQFDVIDSFDKEVSNVLLSINALYDYGQTNNNNYYIPESDKIALLMIKSKSRLSVTQDIRKKVTEKILDLMLKYGNEPKGVPGKEIIKALKPCEKFYNSEEALDFINGFYSLCMELNYKYMHYLKHKMNQV